MSYLTPKRSRPVLWVLLLAALCLALPVFGEEGDSPDFYVPEIPGADVVQETLNEETTVIWYDDQGNEIPVGAEESPLPAPTPENPNSDRTYFDYAGEVNLLTGEPVDKYEVMEKNGIYEISPGKMEYDSINRVYRLYCGENYIECTLPAGATLNANTDPLTIRQSVGLNITLYRDKDIIAQSDVEGITESGAYTLVISDNQQNSVSYGFLLVDRYTNLMNEVYLPDGFSFRQVEMNGQPQTLEYTNYFQFLVDSTYRMVWSCPGIDRTYEVEFTLDRVAPTLALPQVERGFAEQGVTLTDLEEGAVVRCIHDGTERRITDPNEVLTLPGKYTLHVEDRAGNITTYQFRMKVYLDIKAGTALLLLAAMLLAAVLYGHRLRNRPKVY